MDSYTTDQGGLCAGILIESTVNGLTIENNTFYHLEEGTHLLCVNNSQSSACEPPLGTTTSNVTAEFNDFSNIHRIPWEEQPQVSKNVVFEYNTIHDFHNPFFGTFDISMACCDTGATSPGVITTNNVLVENVPTGPSPSYVGYGIEAWGNGAQYNNNLVEGLTTLSALPGVMEQAHWEINNNYVCGPNWAQGNNFIADEGYGQTPPTRTGNVTSATCAAQTSAAPTISPAAGAYSARYHGDPCRCGTFQRPRTFRKHFHLLHHRRKYANGQLDTLHRAVLSKSRQPRYRRSACGGRVQTQRPIRQAMASYRAAWSRHLLVAAQ